MIFTPAYATGTTYAKFNIFCLHSFVSSFEQAIARVCTYYRTRETSVGRSVPTFTSDLKSIADQERLRKMLKKEKNKEETIFEEQNTTSNSRNNLDWVGKGTAYTDFCLI